jgi:hypothetical protein
MVLLHFSTQQEIVEAVLTEVLPAPLDLDANAEARSEDEAHHQRLDPATKRVGGPRTHRVVSDISDTCRRRNSCCSNRRFGRSRCRSAHTEWISS